jgi:hypothetical protein
LELESTPCVPIFAAPAEGIEKADEILPRTERVKEADKKLLDIMRYLGTFHRPRGLTEAQWRSFLDKCNRYFMRGNDDLFKRDVNGEHKLYIVYEKRMNVLRNTHDNIGHRGYRTVFHHLSMRFFWPNMAEDIKWYLQSCEQCQLQRMKHVVIPPTVQHPEPLFHRVYCDTMVMPPAKGRYRGLRYILQARDSLSKYPEYMIVRRKTAEAIIDFLYKNVLCRWGNIVEVVTDNGSTYVKAVEELSQKYNLRHIRISAYNSRANGVVEQSHRTVREAIVKACAGDIDKWPEVVPAVFWAERIAINSATGMSPFYMAHGLHPTLPMDIDQATWLVPPPTTLLSRQELIAYRARQLLKRPEDLHEMEQRLLKS